jgi:LysM repeat protein
MRSSEGERDFLKVADSGAPFHAEGRRTFIRCAAAGIPGAPMNTLTKQAKPMTESTQLNSELLSADARGRKHIPVAVFAVIVIHIVLFMVLLIAAGCRSSVRAKQSITPSPEAFEQQPSARPRGNPPPAIEHAQTTETPTAAETGVLAEAVSASEPTRSAELTKQPKQRTVADRPTATRPIAKVTSSAKIYVVKSGDTLEKIARLHGTTIQAVRTVNRIKGDLIHPGQKLQLAPEGQTPLQVRSEKSERSKEA